MKIFVLGAVFALTLPFTALAQEQETPVALQAQSLSERQQALYSAAVATRRLAEQVALESKEWRRYEALGKQLEAARVRYNEKFRASPEFAAYEKLIAQLGASLEADNLVLDFDTGNLAPKKK